MEIQSILDELQSIASERIKKYYIGQGAEEPLFGSATGAMKPILKRTGKDQALAEALYETGNYDAMYLAGVVAEPLNMRSADFDRWISKAYFYMISDFIVAVTLSESPNAQEVADRFIASGEDLVMSAGWSCYEWLLGSRKDAEFDRDKLSRMLDTVGSSIARQPDNARQAMNRFVIATGVSFKPLHEEALRTAERIGDVSIVRKGKTIALQNAWESIVKEAEKGRVGFKRRHVRC